MAVTTSASREEYTVLLDVWGDGETTPTSASRNEYNKLMKVWQDGDTKEAEPEQQLHREPEEQEDSIVITSPEEEFENARTMGAGLAAGCCGCVLGGPILALITGLSAAHLVKKEGTIGDAARTLGDVALSTHQKATEFDQKHKIVERSTESVGSAWERVRELDSKHRILDKSKDAVVTGWNRTVEFSQRHRLVERSVEGFGTCIDWTVDSVSSVGCNANNQKKTTTTTPECEQKE